MSILKSRFISRSLMLLGLTFFCGSLFAQQFVAPEQITHFGKVYKLAFKNAAPNGRALYEYTTNNEPVEKWTTLVTFFYAKGIKADPDRWLGAMKRGFDGDQSKPYFKLSNSGGHGYASFILNPSAKNPEFESNVHKSFHLEACGGLLVFQYAVRYPVAADQSIDKKQAMQKVIIKENESNTVGMERSDWSPSCK